VYPPGLDTLRRSSSMGLALNRALAAVFQGAVDVSGTLPFQMALGDKVPIDQPSVGDQQQGAGATCALPTPLAIRSAPSTEALAFAGFPTRHPCPGRRRHRTTTLILATRLDSPAYILDLAAEGTGIFDLG